MKVIERAAKRATKRVLIIDDEPSICWGVSELLGEEGFDAFAVGSVEEALALDRDERPDLLLLDVRLPGQDGISAMPQLKEKFGGVPIIVVTAFGDLSTAVRAVEAGAADYLCKPLDANAVTAVVRGALAHRERVAQSPPGRRPLATDGTLIGKSPAMQRVFRRIALAAAAEVPVLITGESGTGKELIARAIHRNGSRRAQPFVPVCLPALNSGLIEAELFGHEKGTFTGAEADRRGLLEAAAGGAVFLDEVGDTPLEVQVKLLRAIEYHEVIPVGSVRPRSIDFRVIAATNQPLERLVQSGRFRTDLYYRLNVFVIEAPPLRDRRDDIPLLCDYFLSISDSGRQCLLDDLALAELMNRQWRGNVRELRNVIEHAAVLARGGTIGLEHLPAESEVLDDRRPRGDSLAKSIREWADRSMPSSVDTPEAESADLYNKFLATVEPPLLESTLEKCGGNQTTAAAVLGIHRSTLRQKLRDAGLK